MLNEIITQEQMDRLRELEKAATPGEWWTDVNVTETDQLICCTPDDISGSQRGYVMGMALTNNNVLNDAELIVALRNNLPKLLDEIDRLQAENERLKQTQAKPVTRKKTLVGDYCCPDCGAAFYGIAENKGKLQNTTPYCGNCGQKLDWDVTGNDAK